MNLYVKSALITVFALILASCGFHLRGYIPIPPSLSKMYVQSDNAYSSFSQSLVTALQNRGIEVVASPQQAPITLEILDEGSSSQIGALSATTETRQYTLFYTVTYQLKGSAGEIITEPQSVTTQRTFTVDLEEVLGSTSAEDTLQEEIRRDAVQRVINQLVSPGVIAAVENATM